jgi:hypothetical protein
METTNFRRLSLLTSAGALCLFLGYVTLDQKARAQEASPASVPELLSPLMLPDANNAGLAEQV